MTKEEYEDFVLRYKGCGACFPMYHTLNRFEKMWFTAIQKDVFELEKENAELKKQQFSLRNERNTFLAQNEQYEKDLIDFNEQLTKAKVFIRSLKSLIEDVCDINYLSKDNTRLLVEAEQFLKEMEK